MENYGSYLNRAFAPSAPLPVSSDDLHFISSEEKTYQDISYNVPPSLRNNVSRSYSSVPPISNNDGTSSNRSLMTRPSQQTEARNYTTPQRQPIQTFHQPINSYGNQNANSPAVHPTTPLKSQNECSLNSEQQLYGNFTQYTQTMPLLFSGSTNYLNPYSGPYAQVGSTRAASQQQVPRTSQHAYNSNQLPTRVNASVNGALFTRGRVSYFRRDEGSNCLGSFPYSGGGPSCTAVFPYNKKSKDLGSYPCNGGPNCQGSSFCTGGPNCPENLPCSGGSECLNSHSTNFSTPSSTSNGCPTNSMITCPSTPQTTHDAVSQNNADVQNQNQSGHKKNRIIVTLAGGEPLFTVPLQTKKPKILASSANSSRRKNKPRTSAQLNQTGNARKGFRKILPALVRNDVQQVNANILYFTTNSSKTMTASHIPVENNGIEIIDLEEFPNQDGDIGDARPYELPNTIEKEQPLRNGTGLEILTVKRGSNSVINTGSTTDSNNVFHNSEKNLYPYTSGSFQATQFDINGTNEMIEPFTLESYNLDPMTQNRNIYNNTNHILQTSGVAATGDKDLRSTELLQHSDGATVDNGNVQADNVGIGTFDLMKEMTDIIDASNTRIPSPIQKSESLPQFPTAVTRIQNGYFAEENYAVSADEHRSFLNIPNIFNLDDDEPNLVIDENVASMDNNISSPVPKKSEAMELSENGVQQDLSVSDSESEAEAEVNLDHHVLNTNDTGQQETTEKILQSLGNGFNISPRPNFITDFVMEATSDVKTSKKHVQSPQSGDAGSSQSGSSTFDTKKNPSPASTGAKKNSTLTFYASSILSLSESESESGFEGTGESMPLSLDDHNTSNSENMTLNRPPSLSSNYHSELTSNTLEISESISSLQTSIATPSMVRVSPVVGGKEVARSIFCPDLVSEHASPIPKNIKPVPQNAFSSHEHGSKRIFQANRSTDDRPAKDFQSKKIQDKPEIIVDGVHNGLQEMGNNSIFHQSQLPTYQTTSTVPVVHDLEDDSEEMNSIALILNSFKHRNSNPNYDLEWKTRSNEVQRPSLPIRTDNQIDEKNAGRVRVSNHNNTSEVGSVGLHTLADVALGTAADLEVTREMTGPLDLTIKRHTRPFNVVQNQNENFSNRNTNYLMQGTPQNGAMSRNQNEGAISNIINRITQEVVQNGSPFQNQNEGNRVNGNRYNFTQGTSQSCVLPHNQHEANAINRNTNQLKQGIPQNNVSIPSSGVHQPYHMGKETNYNNRDGHRHRSSMQSAGKIHANVRGIGMLPTTKRNSVYPSVQSNPKRKELHPESSHRTTNTVNHARNVSRAGLPLGLKSKPTPTFKVPATPSTDLNQPSRTTFCNKTFNNKITQTRYENQKFPTSVGSHYHNGLDKNRRMTVVDEAGSPVVKRIGRLTKPMLSTSASSSLPTLQSVKEKFQPLLDHSPKSKRSSTASTLSGTRTKNGIQFKRLIDRYRNPEMMKNGRVKMKYQRDLNKVYILGSDATPASRNRRPEIGVEEIVRLPTGERHLKRASRISSTSPARVYQQKQTN